MRERRPEGQTGSLAPLSDPPNTPTLLQSLEPDAAGPVPRSWAAKVYLEKRASSKPASLMPGRPANELLFADPSLEASVSQAHSLNNCKVKTPRRLCVQTKDAFRHCALKNNNNN